MKCDAQKGPFRCTNDAIVLYRGLDYPTGEERSAVRCREHELVGEDPDDWSDVDWSDLRSEPISDRTTGERQRELAAIVAHFTKELGLGELQAAIRMGEPRVFEKDCILCGAKLHLACPNCGTPETGMT